MVSPDNAHCPIFVNYHKEEHISESIKYEDEFLNNKEFYWMSKSNRTIKSNDVQSIFGKNGTIRLPLFIKKNNDEGIDFYYMGEVLPELDQVEQTTMKNNSGIQIPVVKILFILVNPVTASMYNYLQEKGNVNNSLLGTKEYRIPIHGTENNEQQVSNLIPLYNFYAAAGTFSELQSEKDFTFIEGPENIKNSNDYFACKIIGESMNRVIPNGSICLFKFYTGGTRNGKIVLIENRDIQDQDFRSAFTIKTYSSEKVISEEGWKHESILLKPNSFYDFYKDIIIEEADAIGMRVIGEFVEILKGAK